MQLGQLKTPSHVVEAPTHTFTPASPQRLHVTKEKSIQSSVRIGKIGIPITAPDYPNFLLLNAILGGYFGSRLMTNIREEKGYTYGISSFNVSMPQGSYWSIATDVNNEHVEATLTEIMKEIQRLRTELVDQQELDIVKHFLHGDLLREVDGVFNQSDALKHKLNYGMDNRIYEELGGEVTFLLVHADTNTESGKQIIADAGYTFPVLFDEERIAKMTYGVNSYPITFFIDAQGNLKAYYSGMMGAEVLQQGIDLIYTAE